MIEEIKLILDSIGDLSGVALWVVGFFLVFKMIIYLSTTGAFVYILKLAITTIHGVMTKEKIVKNAFGRHFIDKKVEQDFIDLLNDIKISTGAYIHSSDIDKLTKMVKEYKEKQK